MKSLGGLNAKTEILCDIAEMIKQKCNLKETRASERGVPSWKPRRTAFFYFMFAAITKLNEARTIDKDKLVLKRHSRKKSYPSHRICVYLRFKARDKTKTEKT